ncbi:MAG: hypothetical protein LBK99_21570 [Opitutaceae bacterium]|jgi:hypothetical protein|nr:hypothetical protein [Opitutaceae bacterium]
MLPALARFAAYIAGILCISYLIYRDARSGPERFGETSWVEMTQLVVLLVSTVTGLRIWRGGSEIRHAALLLATFAGVSFIRECDAFLDEYVFDGCWQVLVFSILAIVFFHIWKNRLSLLAGMKLYLPSSACGLFMGGFLTTYVFSRLFGTRYLWRTALQEGYVKIAKTMAEESTELFGYALLLFSVIEMAVMARTLAAHAARPPPVPDR